MITEDFAPPSARKASVIMNRGQRPGPFHDRDGAERADSAGRRIMGGHAGLIWERIGGLTGD